MVIKNEFIYNTYMPFKKTECACILFAPFFKKCTHKRKLQANMYNC